MNSVTIDSTWITNAGSPPYVLSADDTKYNLTVDVNVDDDTYFGSVFVLTGSNVVLVRNSHAIQINGKDVNFQPTDSSMLYNTSEYAVRCDPTLPVKTYGGILTDGRTESTIVPADADYAPLISPWAGSE